MPINYKNFYMRRRHEGKYLYYDDQPGVTTFSGNRSSKNKVVTSSKLTFFTKETSPLVVSNVQKPAGEKSKEEKQKVQGDKAAKNTQRPAKNKKKKAQTTPKSMPVPPQPKQHINQCPSGCKSGFIPAWMLKTSKTKQKATENQGKKKSFENEKKLEEKNSVKVEKYKPAKTHQAPINSKNKKNKKANTGTKTPKVLEKKAESVQAHIAVKNEATEKVDVQEVPIIANSLTPTPFSAYLKPKINQRRQRSKPPQLKQHINQYPRACKSVFIPTMSLETSKTQQKAKEGEIASEQNACSSELEVPIGIQWPFYRGPPMTVDFIPWKDRLWSWSYTTWLDECEKERIEAAQAKKIEDNKGKQEIQKKNKKSKSKK